jgi:hypothetical protein
MPRDLKSAMSAICQYNSIHQYKTTSSSEKNIFVITFRVAHWSTLDESLAF